MAYLLDTNILLAIFRAGPLGRHVNERFGLTAPGAAVVSAVSIGEMLALSLKLGWGNDKTVRLRDFLNELVVLDINSTDILDAYAQVDHTIAPHGALSNNDLWIAATAKATECTLVTTDRNFESLSPSHIQLEWVDAVMLKVP